MSHHRIQQSAGGTDVAEVDLTQVEEVLRALAAALRSYRLYEGHNPMLDRFVATLRQKIENLWESLPSLTLRIEEDRIYWEEHEVFPRGDSGSELPFLFYKDGIREITLLPGFEEEEALSLLEVLARAPTVRKEEDDLITLLWQKDFSHFRYETVEPGIEGIDLPGPASEKSVAPINIEQVREEGESGAAERLSADDFQDTLYFLDESELRRLREEVQRESARDLWRDVLNALLDRLEDGDAERQQRVVGILGELLPSALASGQFERAAVLLEDLVQLAGREKQLTPEALRDVRRLFDHLGRPETVMQLADILEEMPNRLSEDAVLRLLGYFPPGSLASLMQAAERVQQPAVRRAFETCIQRLAEANRDEIVQLLRSNDSTVVSGALRWVGRLEIGSALGEVTRFLQHPEPGVRVAAVEALVAIRAAAAANGLIPLLQDPAREVRIAAARALGALSYSAARAPLEAVLGSKALKDADRQEKLAYFEAFGRLAGAEGVPLLNRFLNAKSWLGRGESPETRACAALGLARIRHPSAREALSAAANDSDPVVRTTVARALRGEAS